MYSANVDGRDFNPHSHKESDSLSSGCKSSHIDFNPHSHKESDCLQYLLLHHIHPFQSTLSQREWRRMRLQSVNPKLFQSTLSQREWREDLHPEDKDNYISIHTLTKRVTITRWYRHIIWYISIHTLTKRVTTSGFKSTSATSDFNPHSHKESDLYPLGVSPHILISIHTLTKRVTLKVS